MPRALVAFAQWPGGDITLVGPDDQYRVYETAQDRSAFEQITPVLSPDGRFLMTSRGLLDVTTGATRSLEGEAPLGFSADGRLALVARYDSDIEVRGQIRAIDPVTGGYEWAIALQPGPLPRDVSVAVAADGSLVAIKRHANLSLYDSGGRLLWIRPVDGELAGQKALVPQRRSVAVSSLSRICLHDTGNGEGGICHDLSEAFNAASSSGG
ncbi:MAG TPA: hypothetical protein VFC19_08840 [Candidatus Limnocylindrales bacterium]|nr:hypothetical protein [Candidatus Limnocylindrales bacterium]